MTTETGSGWPQATDDGQPRVADPATVHRLETALGVPMDTLKHDAEQTAIAEAQAAADGLKIPENVEFRGRTFTFGNCDSLAPTLDFAEAAEKGLDTEDPAGLVALKSMIRDGFIRTPSCGGCEACTDERYDECEQLDEGDWPRFWRFVKAVRADAEELMGVVQKLVEHQTARPTQQPSGSSSPGGSSSEKSREPSPWPGRSLPAAFAGLPEGDLIDIADARR
jgi:hypothetical protein